jgi:hypothetical protein
VKYFSLNSLYIKIFLVSFFWIIFSYICFRFISVIISDNKTFFGVDLIFVDSRSIHVKAIEIINTFNNLTIDKQIISNFFKIVDKIEGPNNLPILYILSFLYYFFIPNPVVLIPLNALVHALSAVLLFKIFKIISKNDKSSLIATAPFIFFPISFYWNLQILKDGYFILGCYGILFTLIKLYTILINNFSVDSKFFYKILKLIIIYNLSIYLIHIFRNYYIQLINLYSFLFCFFGLIFILLKFRKINKNIFIFPLLVIIFSFSFAINHKFYKFYTSDLISNNSFDVSIKDNKSFSNKIKKDAKDIELKKNNTKADEKTSFKNEEFEINNNSNIDTDLEIKLKSNWKSSNIIPEKIDNLLYRISRQRTGFSNISRTTLDLDVNFSSSVDLIKYIPRAIQIGLFSPFPSMWIIKDETINNQKKIVNLISSINILIIYFIFITFLISFKKIFIDFYSFSMLIFAFQGVVIFSLIVNNIGNLIRMKYGFLILIIGYCILCIFSNRKKKYEI